MDTISQHALDFILNSLWQGCLILAVAALCDRLLRKAPARLGHTLWVIALVASALVPIWSARGQSGPKVPSTSVYYGSGTPKSVPNAPEHDAPPAPHSWKWFNLGSPTIIRSGALAAGTPLSVAVICGFLIFVLGRAIRLGKAWKRTRQIRQSARPDQTPDRILLAKRRCEEALGLRDIPLLYSAHVQGPITIGSVNPSIIAPENFFETTPELEASAALGHEMAHIARQDFLLNYICELVCLPVSFHPLTILAKKRLRACRESACDELVVEKIMNVSEYANSLVSMARRFVNSTRAGYSLGVFDGNLLEGRIKRLLTEPKLSSPMARRLFLTSLVLMTIGGLTSLSFSLRVGGDHPSIVRVIHSLAIPLELSTIGIIPSTSGSARLNYSLINRGQKRLIAAKISWRFILANGSSTQSTNTASYVFSRSMLAPGASDGSFSENIPWAKNDPSLVKKIEGQITFVEFADGTALGPDRGRSRVRLEGMWQTQVQAAQRLLSVYKTRGKAGLRRDINSDSKSDTTAERRLKRYIRSLDKARGFSAGLQQIKMEASTRLPH
jgi:beta-lactamase regulating signal transducer with metallopeptidase domain